MDVLVTLRIRAIAGLDAIVEGFFYAHHL